MVKMKARARLSGQWSAKARVSSRAIIAVGSTETVAPVQPATVSQKQVGFSAGTLQSIFSWKEWEMFRGYKY
jgi:hypothetical protein